MKLISICLTLILIAGARVPGSCQDSAYINKELSSLFANGILLENLGITVPWDLKLADIGKYGDPKVIKTLKRRFIVLWDSATILDGTRIDLRGISVILIGSPRKIKSMAFLGPISVKDGERLRRYFTEYSGQPWLAGKTRRLLIYKWKIFEGCEVALYLFRHRDEGHLDITKQVEYNIHQ